MPAEAGVALIERGSCAPAVGQMVPRVRVDNVAVSTGTCLIAVP